MAYDVVVTVGDCPVDIVHLGVYTWSPMDYSTQLVGIANTEMAAAWNGAEGDGWTEQADRYERLGRVQLEVLLDAAGIAAESSILDIGCGTGASTRGAAQRATRGSATGIDLSAQML